MKLKKRYTAIQLGTKTIDNVVEPTFEHGGISGPYYDEQHPTLEFDTEEEAIKWAYKESSYSRWIIVPIIDFTEHE